MTAFVSVAEATMPVPIGVFRSRIKPCSEEGVHAEIAQAKAEKTESIDELLRAGDTWIVGQG